MPIGKVLSDYLDWREVISDADPIIGSQAGVAILKNDSLPHPKEHFSDIKPSSLFAFPERQGMEVAISSWRIRDFPGKGYHVHEFSAFYLLHRDSYDPKDLSTSIMHFMHDFSFSEKAIITTGVIGVAALCYKLLKKD